MNLPKKIVERGVKEDVLTKASNILPCGSNEFHVKAERPKHTRLYKHKLEESFDIDPCAFEALLFSRE